MRRYRDRLQLVSGSVLMEDDTGSSDARLCTAAGDGGDAGATGGATATSGVSAVTASGASDSVSVRGTGAAHASYGGVAITGYVAGDVRVMLPYLHSRSVQNS